MTPPGPYGRATKLGGPPDRAHPARRVLPFPMSSVELRSSSRNFGLGLSGEAASPPLTAYARSFGLLRAGLVPLTLFVFPLTLFLSRSRFSLTAFPPIFVAPLT